MRHDMTFELDEEIKNKLEGWGKLQGWTIEETIRYILGDKVTKNFAPSLTPISSFSSLPSPVAGRVGAVDNEIDLLIRAVASTGTSKCRNCLKQLTYDEIKAGECSSCGEKI